MRRTLEIGGFSGVCLLAAFLSKFGQERRLATNMRDQIMRNFKLLAGTSMLVVSLLGTTAAQAAGTTAGNTISNTATVSYSVGGVGQPTVSNTPTVFTVDRKVVFRVDETAPIATTTVAPGQSAAVTTFTVSNTSNATMDFGLAVTQQVGGAGAHSNTDNFDVTAPTIYADTNGNGTYEPLTDTTVITYLDEVLADTSRTFFVVANIPSGRATGDVAAVTLTGQARLGGVAATQGAIATNTAGANTAGVDTVLADTAYDALNTASDGLGVAKDDYTVSNAALTITKTVRIIEDPVNTIASGNAANAKLIPGATIEYCIIVANAAGGGVATGVSASDPVPSTLTITPGSVRINGTATAGVCNADGVAGGSIAGQTVSSGTLNNVAAGSNVTMYFRATVN
jgi:uncharacterized repeat protein (TIGR01451 family)